MLTAIAQEAKLLTMSLGTLREWPSGHCSRRASPQLYGFLPIDCESRYAHTDICCLQTLFGAGDVLAQQAVDKKGFDKHDYARTGRMVLYGGGMP
jgi:hypothetical protein